MNTDEHIDELAELYALGALDDATRERVDRHTRTCTKCAARVGEAENFIAQTIPEREPTPALDRRVGAAFAPVRRSSPWWGALVAAAFVAGLLLPYRPPSSFDADRDRAIPALVNSHFLHAQFTPLVADAPKAKVIYGRSAPWRFFIVQTNRAYMVRTQNGTALGTLHVSGYAAELFVPNDAGRSYVLLDGARPVASVRLR